MKDAVNIPIIASLNVAHPDRWIQYAGMMEQAGADALELDLYTIPADPMVPGTEIENRYAEIVTAVRETVKIPIAIKLAPYFTSVAAVAGRFDEIGANGLVLFNRFYQPTIDIEERRIVTSLELSDSYDGRLPLMWIAMLSGQVNADLAATGGVHTGGGCGANVHGRRFGRHVVLGAAPQRHPPPDQGRRGLSQWLDDHGHASIAEVRGVMSLARYENPEDFKRAGYAKVLNRYW